MSRGKRAQLFIPRLVEHQPEFLSHGRCLTNRNKNCAVLQANFNYKNTASSKNKLI